MKAVFAVLILATAVVALTGPACTPKTGAHVDSDFQQWASKRWTAVNQELGFRKIRLAAFRSAIPEYPASKFAGQGIVTAVDSPQDAARSFATFSRLRASGDNTPVELWYIGGELNQDIQAEFAKLNVVTKNFFDAVSSDELEAYTSHNGVRRSQLAALAVLHSSFAEVAYVDSTVAEVAPAQLFAHGEYADKGLLFHPANTKTSPANPIWDLLAINCVDSFEQDHSVILVNKQKAWAAINMAVHLNSRFYSNLLNGNKDSFRFAAAATKTPFAMSAVAPLRTSVVPEALPASFQGLFLMATCPTDHPTNTERFAAAVKFDIDTEFAGMANGSSKTVSIPKAQWLADCTAFPSCSQIKYPKNQAWMVGYLNVTWGSVSNRIQFWTGGTMNVSASGIQTWLNGVGKSCQGLSFFYNKVEVTDAAAGASYLVAVGQDPAYNTLDSYQVKIIFNGAASVAPSALVLAALAVAAFFANKQ